MPSVLLFTQDLQLAGSQRQCAELALGLAAADGWRVQVATMEQGGPLEAVLHGAGIPLHVCPRAWRWDLSPARMLASLARDQELDLIYSFLFLPNFYARLSRLFNPRPVVVSSMRSSSVPGWYRYVTEILMAPLCNLVIANSESGRNALIARGVSPRRVLVIRNGLDLDRFSELRPAGARPACADRAARIGMVARMEEDKDHATVVKALAKVAAGFPDVRLILAGDGSLRPLIEAPVRIHELADRVTLLGNIDHPEQVYGDIDIYVQASSIGEGTSNSLIEAMASGLPVIATALGGNREVVVDGRTGILVPPRDPGSLAAAMIRLLSRPDEAARMGEQGKARALSTYSRPSMLATTIAAFEQLLGAR